MNKLMLVMAVGTVCSVAAAQQPADAGSAGAPAVPATSGNLFDTEITLNADHAFRADVDGGGDVSATRSMLSAWIGRAFTPEWRGTLLVSTEFSWYDFHDAPGVIAGYIGSFKLPNGVKYFADDLIDTYKLKQDAMNVFKQ